MKKLIAIVMILFLTCMLSSCNNTSDYIDYYKYVGCTFDELAAAEGQPDDDFMYTYYRTAYGIDGATIKFSPSLSSYFDSEDSELRNIIDHISIEWHDIASGKIDSTYKKIKKALTAMYGESTEETTCVSWENGKITLWHNDSDEEEYIAVLIEQKELFTSLSAP